MQPTAQAVGKHEKNEEDREEAILQSRQPRALQDDNQNPHPSRKRRG